ncbi:hypothetical protein D3C80_2118750 [compost metagenome]
MNIEHIFSHILWDMHVFKYAEHETQNEHAAAKLVAEHGEGYTVSEESKSVDEPMQYRWITKADMEQLTFPNVFLKILNHYFDKLNK